MLRTPLFAGIFRTVMIVVAAAALVLGTITSFGMSVTNHDHVHHAMDQGHGHDHDHSHDDTAAADDSDTAGGGTAHPDFCKAHVHVLTALPPDTTLSFAGGRHVSASARLAILLTSQMHRLDRPPKHPLA